MEKTRSAFGYERERALILYSKELRYFMDIWNLERYEFLTWEDAKVNFSLKRFTKTFRLNY